MTAGGVEQYVILAFSSKEGQEKCTNFAILSLTLGLGDAYDPAALGRLGPGGAMTLRSARGLLALAVVFASIGAGVGGHRGLAGLRPHQLPRHQGCRRCHRPAQLEA